MTKNFQVNIYATDQTLYEGPAVSLVVPSASGYLGILSGHAPLVANLAPGKIILRLPNGHSNMFESSTNGFLEVLKNQATLFL